MWMQSHVLMWKTSRKGPLETTLSTNYAGVLWMRKSLVCVKPSPCELQSWNGTKANSPFASFFSLLVLSLLQGVSRHCISYFTWLSKDRQSIRSVYVAEGHGVPHGTVSGPFEVLWLDLLLIGNTCVRTAEKSNSLFEDQRSGKMLPCDIENFKHVL